VSIVNLPLRAFKVFTTKNLNFKRGFLLGVTKPQIEYNHGGGFPNLW